MTPESKLSTSPHEPSMTHSCESSRAPKKTTKLLKQHLTSERRTAKNKGFQVRPQAQESTEASSVHTSPFSETRRPSTGEQDRKRPQDPSSPSRRNYEQNGQSTQELTQNMCSLSSQALQRRAACSGPATAPHEHTNNPPMYCTPTSNDNCHCITTGPPRTCPRTGTAQPGGCHWECCMSRFRQYEPLTMSNRTHAWPWASTNDVRSSDGLECAATRARAIGSHLRVSRTFWIFWFT